MLGLLSDAFYHMLDRIDDDLASIAQAGCCPCDGRLDRADYPRKPRGGPSTFGCDRRRSFCCAVDGCRKRTTPPSVRFLGRKVYFGAVVVLATALRHGPTSARLARLRADFGVSAQTLARWRVWWRETFAESDAWKLARARFAPPVDEHALPASLVERFSGDITGCLRLLAPLVT